ncbi:MAG: hypothetical protein R3F56_12980 [Planctomycetota bacterium]
MRAVLSAWLVLAAPVAQQPDPTDRPIRVRVVGRDDGLPRPGVEVYVVDRRRLLAPPENDGWSVAADLRLRALQVGRAVRTDPSGEAVVLVPDGNPSLADVRVGPPFIDGGLEPVGEVFVLRVGQHEPFAVRVVDPAGRALARFPVALHAAGRDEAVALTDAHGLAVLGVPPNFTARLHVAPSGWIGPYDAFPTVTTSLRKTITELVVPPFGTVRLRAVRDGQQALVRAQCYVFEPNSCVVPLRDGQTPTKGVELGPVALGQRLRAALRLGDRDEYVRLAGPTRAGECVVADYDVDPPRCRLAARVRGVEPAPVGAPVQIALRTDLGVARHTAQVRADGAILLDPPGGLRGARLLRVDLDVEVSPSRTPGQTRPASAWSATVAVACAMTPTVIDLGEVALVSHPPVARGRVVDKSGQPLAGMRIDVQGEPGAGTSWRIGVPSDTDGRFVVWSPVLRDSDGKAVRVVVSTRAASHTTSSDPVAQGDEVVLVVPATGVAAHKPSARLEAVVIDLGPRHVHDVRLELVAAGGERPPRRPSSWQPREGSGLRAVWTALPAGGYTLRAVSTLGDVVWQSEPLRVEAAGSGRDPRLQALRLRDALQEVTLQVVDEAGVPIAGALVTFQCVPVPTKGRTRGRRDANPRSSSRATDGTGHIEVTLPRGTALRVGVRADGRRPREFDGIPRDPVVLEPAGVLAVRVEGLPLDVPRRHLSVRLRHADRLDLSSMAPLGDGDVARLPMPVAGPYRVMLCVLRESETFGMAGTVLGRGEALTVSERGTDAFTLAIDAATLSRLRAALVERDDAGGSSAQRRR